MLCCRNVILKCPFTHFCAIFVSYLIFMTATIYYFYAFRCLFLKLNMNVFFNIVFAINASRKTVITSELLLFFYLMDHQKFSDESAEICFPCFQQLRPLPLQSLVSSCYCAVCGHTDPASFFPPTFLSFNLLNMKHSRNGSKCNKDGQKGQAICKKGKFPC